MSELVEGLAVALPVSPATPPTADSVAAPAAGLALVADLCGFVLCAVAAKSSLQLAAAAAGISGLFAVLAKAAEGGAANSRALSAVYAAQAIADFGKRRAERPSIVARLLALMRSEGEVPSPSADVRAVSAEYAVVGVYNLAGRPGTKPDMEPVLEPLLQLIRNHSEQGRERVLAVAAGALLRLAMHPPFRAWLQARVGRLFAALFEDLSLPPCSRILSARRTLLSSLVSSPLFRLPISVRCQAQDTLLVLRSLMAHPSCQVINLGVLGGGARSKLACSVPDACECSPPLFEPIPY